MAQCSVLVPIIWANSGDQIQHRTLHRIKRETTLFHSGMSCNPNSFCRLKCPTQLNVHQCRMRRLSLEIVD